MKIILSRIDTPPARVVLGRKTKLFHDDGTVMGRTTYRRIDGARTHAPVLTNGTYSTP